MSAVHETVHTSTQNRLASYGPNDMTDHAQVKDWPSLHGVCSHVLAHGTESLVKTGKKHLAAEGETVHLSLIFLHRSLCVENSLGLNRIKTFFRPI